MRAWFFVQKKKILSKLQVSDSVKKHYKIYDHMALAFSGISGDAKAVVTKARDYCLRHSHVYSENVPIEGLLKYLCGLSLKFGEKDVSKKIFSRPFGASILIAGYDTEPRLYSLDPSGSYRRYKAKAIGSAYEAVESELGEEYCRIQSCDEAVKRALSIIGKVIKDPLTKDNVEVAVVKQDEVFFLTDEEIGKFI
jgi:20S proteasome subunit alpha 5